MERIFYFLLIYLILLGILCKVTARRQCSFEESLCDWKVSESSTSKFTRTNGSLHLQGSATAKNQHYGNASGYYMLFGGKHLQQGDFAVLVSNYIVRPKDEKCTFSWLYFMNHNGSGFIGELSILYRDPVSRTRRVLWSANNISDDWMHGNVTFSVTSFNFQILIHAYLGNSTGSYIAIDDVSFSADCFNDYGYEHLAILQSCYEKGKSLSTKLYTLKNNTGSIVVPQHNTYYDCKWKILAQKNLRINLQAEYFQTSSIYHMVSIDAGKISSNQIGGIFYGTKVPFGLTSSNNSIEIKFTSRFSWATNVFKFMLFTTDGPARALGNLTEEKTEGGKAGEICVVSDCQHDRILRCFNISSKTRLYSSEIMRYGRECNVTFTVPPGYRVKLEVVYFKTVHRLSASTDPRSFVHIYKEQIYYGYTKSLYGWKNPFLIVSKNEKLVLGFSIGIRYSKWNGNVIVDFEATTMDAAAVRDFIPEGSIVLQRDCNDAKKRFFLTSSLNRVTPLVVNGRYKYNESCVFRFVAPTDYRMLFEFLEFETELNKDILQLDNNSFIGNKMKFSGRLDPFYMVTKSNKANMTFTSDLVNYHIGFVLRVTKTSKPASGVLPMDSAGSPSISLSKVCYKNVNITRENLVYRMPGSFSIGPKYFGINVRDETTFCRLNFKTQPGFRIQFKVYHCSPESIRRTQHLSIGEMVTASNKAEINLFYRERYFQRLSPGCLIEFKAVPLTGVTLRKVCHGTEQLNIYGKDLIETPLDPYFYGYYRTAIMDVCTYEATTEIGGRLRIDFPGFSTESNYEYIEFDNSTSDLPAITRFSGILKPFSLTSKSNRLVFRFKADEEYFWSELPIRISKARTNERITPTLLTPVDLTAIGVCGKTIILDKNGSGIISPRSGNSYLLQETCYYQFTSTLGSRIHFVIDIYKTDSRSFILFSRGSLEDGVTRKYSLDSLQRIELVSRSNIAGLKTTIHEYGKRKGFLLKYHYYTELMQEKNTMSTSEKTIIVTTSSIGGLVLIAICIACFLKHRQDSVGPVPCGS